MNILLISAVFPPEPVVSASLSNDIAFELAKENKVTVLCPNPTRPHGFVFEKRMESLDYKVIRLNSYSCSASKVFHRFRESYSFGKHCFKYIVDNHKNIDVIYANSWPLFAQYFTVKAAQHCKIPITIHVQDIYPESLSNKLPILDTVFKLVLLPIDKYVLENATKVIAISDNMKDYLIKARKIEPEKIEVVQNWQDEEAFITYEKAINYDIVPNKPFTFMYLGNIGPVAGIDLLIEAFAKADLQNCRLAIAGSGSMKESLEMSAKKVKGGIIEFWPVPDGKVPEIQALADILLLPIKRGAAFSSIPSKLPAYMFSKRPIIACVEQDSDTARVINLANCGWVLPPENVSALSKMMAQVILISKEDSKELGMNGFNYAIRNLSKMKNLEKVIKCITDRV